LTGLLGQSEDYNLESQEKDYGPETFPFDVADYLTDDETITAYLTEVLESDDPRHFPKAQAAVTRARGGMAEAAQCCLQKAERVSKQ
jgi:probable addiction module antidote protein